MYDLAELFWVHQNVSMQEFSIDGNNVVQYFCVKQQTYFVNKYIFLLSLDLENHEKKPKIKLYFVLEKCYCFFINIFIKNNYNYLLKSI